MVVMAVVSAQYTPGAVLKAQFHLLLIVAPLELPKATPLVKCCVTGWRGSCAP